GAHPDQTRARRRSPGRRPDGNGTGRAHDDIAGGRDRRMLACPLGASMDISFSAFAALLGAAIGGLSSGLASWVTHRIQVRTQWLAQDTLRRQELYKEFIEAAAK